MIKKLFTLFQRIQYRFYNVQAYYYSILFMSCGENLKFYGKVNIKNPKNIKVGNNVSFNDGVYLNGLGKIEIGNNVSISALSIIVSTGLDPKSLEHKKEHKNKKIIIGNNVQIGAGAIILSGVMINNNVIVGAGSVVTKNVTDNCIVAGNPAKLLRYLPRSI